MKKSAVLLSLLLTSLTASHVALHAQTPPPKETAPDAAPKKKKETTELGEKMETMGGTLRKLRRQVTDASKNADSLKMVAEVRQAAEASAKLTPAMAADIPEAKRAEFVTAYQKKMNDFVGKVAEVEALIQAGKNEEAGKLLATFGAIQKEGHTEFKKPDEKK